MIDQFFSGLSFHKKGFRFLMENKKLFKFICIPIFINIILFAGLSFLIYNYYGPVYNHLNERLGHVITSGEGWMSTLLAGVLWFFSGILRVLVAIVLLSAMVIGMYFLAQIVNSPFYDLLSEATEIIVKKTGDETPFSFAKLIHQIKSAVILELKKMVFFILVPLLLLVLNIIPLLGSLLYTILANLFVAWAFGFNFLSYTPSRKLITFGAQIKSASRHKSQLVGFGLPMMIPFFNLLFAPLFVIGGTLMYLDFEN